MPHPPLGVQRLQSDYRRALEVGVRAFVNFQPDQPDHTRTCVRGWSPERYILLDAPAEGRARVEFKPGASWQLQYVARGNACVARTEYIESTSERIEGVYVTFPAEISVHPLRTHHRVEVELPAQYGHVEGERDMPTGMGPTTVCDLSLGGCSFTVQEAVARDTRLCLALSPAAAEAPVLYTGTVRRTTETDAGQMVGLQFDTLTPEQRPVLVRLLGAAGLQPDIMLREG